MVNTNFIICGTGTVDTGNGGVFFWNNAYRIASDTSGTYATAVTSVDGATSYKLRATNFGFNIPSGATITGIEVEYQRKASHAEAGDNEVVASRWIFLTSNNSFLVYNNAQVGTYLQASSQSSFSTTDELATLGGSSELWGYGGTITPAIVNSSSFGVNLQVFYFFANELVTAGINYIKMKVYYKITETKTFSNDILLEEAYIKTFSNDLKVKGTITETFSNDLKVKGTITETFSNDLKVKGTINETFSNDILLEEVYTESFSNDIIIKKVITETFSNDILVKSTGIKNTGWNNPSSSSDLGGGEISWYNLSNCYSSDNNYTNCHFGGIISARLSNELFVNNFGFNIPSNVIIKGIEVRYECYTYNANTAIWANYYSKNGYLNLRYNGNPIGNQKEDTNFWPTSDQYMNPIGSNNDLWGTNITPSIVNDNSFGIGGFLVMKGSQYYYIDNIQIRITYCDNIKSFSNDILLEEVNTKSFSNDLIVVKTKSFSNDLIIRGLEFSNDILLEDINTETFSNDLKVKGTITKTFSNDLIVVKTKSFSNDLIIRGLEFSNDIILQFVYSSTFTNDLIVNGKSFSNDILLEDINTETFSNDLKVKGTITKTFSNDLVTFYKRKILINSTDYVSKTTNIRWYDGLNNIKESTLKIKSITPSNTDVVEGKEIEIYEENVLRFYGEIRKVTYLNNETVNVECKGWLVKFKDRKQYNSGDNNYTTKWDSTRTDTVMTSLINSNSVFTIGTLYDNGTDFDIKNENSTQWSTIKKMIKMGLGDIEVVKT